MISLRESSYLPENKLTIKMSGNVSFKAVSNLKPLSMPQNDVVEFTGRRNILADYGINPDEVEVVSKSPQAIDRKTKILLIQKVLEAHEQAAKNKELGNLSGRTFATNMMFENGHWAVASNIENSDEIVLCGERSALVTVWNKTLSKLSLGKLRTDAAYKQKALNGLKVKYMAMSNFSPPGTAPAGNACSDCLSWMNLDRFFQASTQIAVINKDPQNGKYKLTIRPLTEQLPYWGKQQPSITDKPIESLPVQISDRAKAAVVKANISQEQLIETIQKAKEAYEDAQTTELSDKKVAASVLLSPGDVISKAERMDWTRRWFIPPDILAASNGYQLVKQCQRLIQSGMQNLQKVLPSGGDNADLAQKLVGHEKDDVKINAVAYYGNEKVPYIESLGRISQDRGSGDTLVVLVENDTVQVRTILDYMPYLYISSKKPKTA